MKNLYEVLELAPVPSERHSADAIKRAYRRLAAKYHPDREGGNTERMQEIQAAYDVLSDPVKRARYDATGEVAAPAPDKVAEAIKRLFAQVCDDPLVSDPIKTMREHITGETTRAHEAIRMAEARIKRRLRMANRIKRQGDGENVLRGLLMARVESERREIEAVRAAMVDMEGMLKAIGEYQFEEVDVGGGLWA